MIGLVLVTHGRLASEFIRAMEHVVGPQERIEAICIGPEDDMEGRRNDIAEAIARGDRGARGRAQVHLGRVRDPGRGRGLKSCPRERSTSSTSAAFMPGPAPSL